MSGFENIKPSYDEWMYWTQVVVDRLTTISHVYSNPPHPEIFIAEKERQEKLDDTVVVMRRLHELTDAFELDIPKEAADVAEREAALISQLQPAFQAVMERLPQWSNDMQRLLRSPWMNQCEGKLATILFRGQDGRLKEGIGSGMVEHGRLPAQIAEMLDREAAGGDRAPRVEKPRFADARMRREEVARLWAKHNSAFLRTAGRMD
ncbi:MAG: hypothetical protein AB7E52_06910 [Bdellovibrionales bacterium]